MKPIYLFIVISLITASCKKEFSYEGGQTPSVVFVTTLAGSGQAGFKDDKSDAALFRAVKGIAIDGEGNLYVGDTGNNRLRKISTKNIVTTLAGNGKAGYADGSATTAMFHSPADAVADDVGNVYISDMNNNCIRRITPDGTVTTIAGGTAFGFSDGSGTTAMFNVPRGIVLDDKGNLYVVDMNNNRIRKISTTGEVSTFAGSGRGGYRDGAAGVAQFNAPRGLARDKNGNLYVADKGNNCIRKISPDGVVTTVAGTPAAGYQDGNGTVARFNQPRGVAADSRGNIYVGDTGNNRIRKIWTTGIVTTIAGTGSAGLVNGAGASAEFNRPRAMVVDRQNKYLYVADQSNNCIRRISIL